MSGVWVLVVVLALLGAFGIWKQLHDGRMRSQTERPVVTEAQVGQALGEKATLLQFTSAFCAPCRATRRILEEVAAMVPGVKHVDLDVEYHSDLVREFDVTRTPTVLILDGEGVVIKRASGQPRKADVIAALGDAIPA